MKGLAGLCLVVLWLIPTISLSAELPLTPQILDKIKAEAQDYEAHLDGDMTTEEMREAIQGRIFGLQAVMMASLVVGLPPSQRAFLIEAFHEFKRAPIVGVEPNTIRHEAIMYTYNLMIAGLYHSLAEGPDVNASP